MIVGCGIDIIEIKRVEDLRKRYQGKFLNRIFSPGEKEYCCRKVRMDMHLAARFAAKEALIKALGDNIKVRLPWSDLEVINTDGGKPEIFILGKSRDVIENLGINSIFLSISHSYKYAVAQVILEK